MPQSGKIVKKLLGKFPLTEEITEKDLVKWFELLQLGLPEMRTYSVSLDLASVGANSWSRQTVTVTGLRTSDIVSVNPPSLTTGLHYVSARISAADTLELTLYNDTGGAIDEGAATWLILTTHK